MEQPYLNTRNFIKGLSFSLLEWVFPQRRSSSLISWPMFGPAFEFGSIKLLKDSEIESGDKVFSGRDKAGKKVIIRNLNYRFKNLRHRQMVNEAAMLRFLASRKVKTNGVKFPRVYQLTDTGERLILVREFVEGRELKDFRPEAKLRAVKTCLQAFKDLSAGFSSREIKKLPKRTPGQMILSFPVCLLIASLRNPGRIRDFLKLAVKFYQQYFSVFGGRTRYVIAHRDLSSENILIDGKKIRIIDPEIATLAEEETDLALAGRFFFKELEDERLVDLIESSLKTRRQRQNFLRLSIFYTVQFLTFEERSSRFYQEAEAYLDKLLQLVIPRIEPSRESPVEFFSRLVLSFIYQLNKKVGWLRRGKKSVVLCYHSVGDDGWRFSVPPREFEKQIELLRRTKKIVSLGQLVNSQKNLAGRAAITFDDGYRDIFEQAMPILKQLDLPATIFVTGVRRGVNREELGNGKALLTISQIKEFYRMGWEIGFHTKTHPDLRDLSEEELRKEIVVGKQELEKKLGFKIRYFAYPRGIYTERIIKVVQEAGFEAAFTVDGSGVNSKDGDFCYSRVSLEGGFDLEQFGALLSPLGLWFQSNMMAFLKLKENIIRRVGAWPRWDV